MAKSIHFSDIISPIELREYLDAPARLNNSRYLYHYTSVAAVIGMLNTKRWHLCSAKDMNDRVEYDAGDIAIWNNLFFSSFMGEEKENVGMWSMYAQPWNQGVKIAIPKGVFKQWVKETRLIYEISKSDYSEKGEPIYIDEYALTIKISSVAYCDYGYGEVGDQGISWSNKKNYLLRNIFSGKILTGYIKDRAWAYEKEVRVKAEFNNLQGIERVAIPLTEKVIDAMVITASPLFKGDLKSLLKKKTGRTVHMDSSKFTNKLKVKDPCGDCVLKKD